MMLSMMISGPRQHGNDINAYLIPLVEDLKMLWMDGVETFDVFASKTFIMRAMLFCTINGFPTDDNLLGYNVKDHKACPICEENASGHQLKYGRKKIYTRHRRFLQSNHPYRRLKTTFNGHEKNDDASTALNEKVNKIHNVFGKTPKKSSATSPWKKKNQYSFIFHIGQS